MKLVLGILVWIAVAYIVATLFGRAAVKGRRGRR